MAEPWAGLVPDDTTGPSDARDEMARAHGAPTGTEPPSPAPMTIADEALDCARRAHGKLDQLLALERLRNHPAQIHPITFNPANNKQYIVRSSHPPVGGSVGIVNPFELIVYLGLDGGRAAPNSHAFMVPPKSAMVIPVAVDKFDIGVDPAVLLEESVTIHLLRFQTVQPFFLGAM
jgi:hypothetical protein